MVEAERGAEIIREACQFSPELAAAAEVWQEITFEYEGRDVNGKVQGTCQPAYDCGERVPFQGPGDWMTCHDSDHRKSLNQPLIVVEFSAKEPFVR
jgi:hypothetical protein